MSENGRLHVTLGDVYEIVTVLRDTLAQHERRLGRIEEGLNSATDHEREVFGSHLRRIEDHETRLRTLEEKVTANVTRLSVAYRNSSSKCRYAQASHL